MKTFIKENWFKIIIAVAILIVAVAVGYYFVSNSSKRIPTDNSIDLLNQQRCATQAEKWINDNNYESKYFTNHYNKPLNKCFALYRYDTTNFINSFLVDVFENYKYANVLWSGKELVDCYTKEGTCTKMYEFSNFINQYIGN